MAHKYSDNFTRKALPSAVKWAVLFSFAALAVVVAIAAYRAAYQLTTTWEMTQLEGVAVSHTPTPGSEVVSGADPDPDTEAVSPPDNATAEEPSNPQVNETPTPRPKPEPPIVLPTPDPWNGTDRVTILVLGLDYGDWASEDRKGPPRSDTMMLLTIDPVTKTAGMLSIPRDLYVKIPGMEGHHKINTAHRFGEIYKLPGGGPGLAMRTVEQVVGVPIDYYARIDFYAFEQFIDELGGIQVDVADEITVDPIGEHNTVVLKPGRQLLDGPVALAYARNRYTKDGDFDRARRQQQVIMAIRERILRLDMLPKLVYKAPALFNDLSAGIQTNLALDQAIQLAWLAQQIEEEDIRTGVIGSKEVLYGTVADGQAIFQPIPSRIQALRDEVFGPGMAAPMLGISDREALLEAESARVVVAAAEGAEEAAEEAAEKLRSNGINVVDIRTEDDAGDVTQVIVLRAKPYTSKYVLELLGISGGTISNNFESESEVDVVIILGEDYTGS